MGTESGAAESRAKEKRQPTREGEETSAGDKEPAERMERNTNGERGQREEERQLGYEL